MEPPRPEPFRGAQGAHVATEAAESPPPTSNALLRWLLKDPSSLVSGPHCGSRNPRVPSPAAAVSLSDHVSTVRCVLAAQRTRSKTGLPPLYLPICQQHPPLAEANRSPMGMAAWGGWSADFPSPAQKRAWKLGGGVHKQII